MFSGRVFAVLLAITASASAGPMYTTLVVPGSWESTAYSINNSGQIAGSYTVGATSGRAGFIYSGGVYSTLAFPSASSTEAMGINDVGDVVGYYYLQGGLAEGFIYSNGSFTTFNYPGAQLTLAYSVNNNRQIVGLAQDATRDIYYLYSAGAFSILATYPLGSTGGSGVMAGINGLGKTVGPFTGLVIPGNYPGHAANLNDSGDVVGWYQTSKEHGFLDHGGTFYAVDVPGTFSYTLAEGINNSGDIVGFYNGTGACIVECGFLLTGRPLTEITGPNAPEPHTLLLLVSGAGLILRRRVFAKRTKGTR